MHLLWEEGNSKYSGSGALFVESRTDSSQFYLLVPVNLGAGRPFALFGTGGDYESDLEKAEAYGEYFWSLSMVAVQRGGIRDGYYVMISSHRRKESCLLERKNLKQDLRTIRRLLAVAQVLWVQEGSSFGVAIF